ncbi:hypothetical protein [Desulforegula conservatrix]|nr:hypothetical protein [Desulforegula conservatrix]
MAGIETKTINDKNLLELVHERPDAIIINSNRGDYYCRPACSQKIPD